jgi:hypothetical protein
MDYVETDVFVFQVWLVHGDWSIVCVAWLVDGNVVCNKQMPLRRYSCIKLKLVHFACCSWKDWLLDSKMKWH